MNEQKSKLPSLRNKDWKRIKDKTEKVNKILQNTPTDSITELNKSIHTTKKKK